MSNIQIAAKAELFGAPIDAAFISNEHEDISGIKVPAKKYTVSEKTLVVYGKPDDPIRQKLTEVLSKLTFGLVSEDTLKTKLPEVVAKTLDGISVAVNQVYFKSTTVDLFEGADIVGQEEEKDLRAKYGTNDKDYALWIDVDINPDLMAGFPVKVTTLSIKIWSTDNKKVLQEMKITDIQKLLAGAGVVAETAVTDVSTDSENNTKKTKVKTETPTE